MLNMHAWPDFIGNFNISFHHFLFNNELYDMSNVAVFNIFRLHQLCIWIFMWIQLLYIPYRIHILMNTNSKIIYTVYEFEKLIDFTLKNTIWNFNECKCLWKFNKVKMDQIIINKLFSCVIILWCDFFLNNQNVTSPAWNSITINIKGKHPLPNEAPPPPQHVPLN